MFANFECMNQICDRLYLGNIMAASDRERLQKNKIKCILQVAAGVEPFFPDEFVYRVIQINDASDQNLLQHLPSAINFIKTSIQAGKNVLVHCHAGVSRSATVVIAFLMQERGMLFEDAFSFVSKKRPVVFPNMGF